MVAVACLMMMATLSVEYVRLVYPTQDTGLAIIISNNSHDVLKLVLEYYILTSRLSNSMDLGKSVKILCFILGEGVCHLSLSQIAFVFNVISVVAMSHAAK